MKRLLAVIGCVLLLSGVAFGATYYIDQTGGLDANTGLATDNAWKTISKVNGSSFSAGDSILFKKGETWTGNFVVPSSGGIGNPIIFGAYGTGNAPIINATDNNMAFAGLIYNIGNVTIDGLRFRNGGFGLIGSIVDNIIINNVVADNNRSVGIGLMSSAWRVTTKNSTAYNNGGTGIYYEAATGDVVDGLVDNCVAYSNGFIDNTDDPYAVYGGGIRTAAGPPWGSGFIVQNSTAYNNGIGHTGPYGGHGIWVDAVPSPIVRYNKSYGNLRDGIFAEALSNGGEIYYNLSYNNGTGVGWESGISVEGRNTQPSDNVLVYNNVAYGNNIGIRVNSQDNAASTIMRTYVRNNISTGNAFQLVTFSGGQNDGTMGSGNVYTYNGFGPQASNFIMWGWGVGKSTYADFDTAYGAATHSMTADPLFVSTVTPDFHLQFASPAKNAGVDVGLTQDYAGRAVPNGAGVDIGAYEWYGKMSLPTSPSFPSFPDH